MRITVPKIAYGDQETGTFILPFISCASWHQKLSLRRSKMCLGAVKADKGQGEEITEAATGEKEQILEASG